MSGNIPTQQPTRTPVMPAAVRTFCTTERERWCSVNRGSGRPSFIANLSMVPCKTMPVPFEIELPIAAEPSIERPRADPM